MTRSFSANSPSSPYRTESIRGVVRAQLVVAHVQMSTGSRQLDEIPIVFQRAAASSSIDVSFFSVQRAAYGATTFVEHVRIDHGGIKILMP